MRKLEEKYIKSLLRYSSQIIGQKITLVHLDFESSDKAILSIYSYIRSKQKWRVKSTDKTTFEKEGISFKPLSGKACIIVLSGTGVLEKRIPKGDTKEKLVWTNKEKFYFDLKDEGEYLQIVSTRVTRVESLVRDLQSSKVKILGIRLLADGEEQSGELFKSILIDCLSLINDESQTPFLPTLEALNAIFRKKALFAILSIMGTVALVNFFFSSSLDSKLTTISNELSAELLVYDNLLSSKEEYTNQMKMLDKLGWNVNVSHSLLIQEIANSIESQKIHFRSLELGESGNKGEPVFFTDAILVEGEAVDVLEINSWTKYLDDLPMIVNYEVLSSSMGKETFTFKMKIQVK